jgi:uncharacterized protein YggE
MSIKGGHFLLFNRLLFDKLYKGREVLGITERLIMRGMAVLLVSSFVAFQIHADPELRGSAYDLEKFLSGIPKTVAITGESETKLPADRAIVMLKISTENKYLEEALKSNQVSRTKLLGYLKNKSIPLERVQASKFSSTPKYGWFSEKAKSYRVDNFVKVTVQDEGEFQAVAGAVDTWPEIQYLSIDFEHSNKETLKAQAIAKACDNANDKRKLYEEKFGVQLTVRKFSEGQVEEKGPVVAAGEDVNAVPTRRFGVGRSPEPASSAPSLQEGTSPFGELTYTVHVSVEYSVEQK